MSESPGSHNNAVFSCSKISAIWSIFDVTIAFPIAIYSNSLVGEPKKGVPSEFLTWGDAKISHAAKYFGPWICGTMPVNVHLFSIWFVWITFFTSGILRPSPTSNKCIGTDKPSSFIKFAKACANSSAPCHGPKVPINPISTVESDMPIFLRIFLPSTSGEYISGFTPLGLTMILLALMPKSINWSFSGALTQVIRSAFSKVSISIFSDRLLAFSFRPPHLFDIHTSDPLYSRTNGRLCRNAYFIPAYAFNALLW